jgi:predicted nucleic acid-binding protein
MKGTFVDTSFLLALLLRRDAYHERALAWQQATIGEVVTTEYVLTEFVDALSAEPVRGAAVEAVSEFRAARETRMIAASTTLLDQGRDFFATHRDKRWSLTDSISFLVMRREGISDALTSDHHFEQAGFRALLRSDPP